MSLVIIIPIYKMEIDQFEQISLRQILQKKNSESSIIFIGPEGLDMVNYSGFVNAPEPIRFEAFEPKYFQSPNTYNRLFMHPKLYNRFKEFEYMLIYHLDAFLFDGNIETWCSQGFDNIGAPIYEYNGTENPKHYLGVGNGGFCLRRVESCIRVLKSFRRVYTFQNLVEDFKRYNWKGRVSRFSYYLILFIGIGNRAHYRLNYLKINEDIFWGVLVPLQFPWFKVPDRLTAAQFSLEFNCKPLFEENGRRLPLGCHGWNKPLFINFWRPIFQDLGIEI